MPVDELVVVLAEQSGVGDCGDAAAFPWVSVVDVAGPDGRGTGFVFAMAVAGDDCFGDGWGNGSAAAADVQRFAAASGDDPADVGVLGQLTGLRPGDDGA